ncbi:MAG: GNAT family N-acetyltransferase [Nitrospiraceae bacterium]
MSTVHVRPSYVPPPSQDIVESGYLILRDGTTAIIRIAQPSDQQALQTFVDRLSPESKRHRFFSETVPSPEVIESLCDSSDPRSKLTLIVTRFWEGVLRIIAAGSYLAKDERTAEVAMAVDDAFHGKGLGTLLLERLALLAIRHGFTRLWAVTHADNLAMREVFRESGYAVRETFEGGDIEVELSVIPTETSVTRSEVRDRIATIASLRPLFQPQAVAVLGASRDPVRIGNRLVQALVTNRFQGPIYPINPKASEVVGLKAYRSVRDVPGPLDLAIIAVPRDAVLAAVDVCAAKGVRAVVVISAGFAEVNAEGRELQKRLVEKVRQYGMRLVGPNCFGLVNADPSVRLNATFSSVFPPSGWVAMSSQSGALGLAILAAARRLQMGISTFVSVGNKADVSGNDLLQYWEEDPNTNVILLYLESFGNPRRFARIARRVSRRKPIVAVKAGRSQSGRRAAGSHTAALAASDVAAEALFHQTGVIRAETLEEMFALAAGLANQPLPTGRRVAIVTNAGGPAVLCTDACEAGGLEVPELSEETRVRLAAFLPAAAAVKNPIDLIASATPDQYRKAIETILSADEVDALIVLYISVSEVDTAPIAEGILAGIAASRTAGGKGKPVLACWMAEGDRDRSLALTNETIPTYRLPEIPARVLSRALAYAEWRAQPVGLTPDFQDLDLPMVREVCAKALSQRCASWLTTEETRTVLTAMGLPVQPGGVAQTEDDAVELARRVGFPVAVKLASHHLVHKTEIGGVRLSLKEESAVRQAFREIRDRLAQDNNLDAMEGVLVQPMVTGGVEVMIGVTHDPLFGPLIAFGLGGIHVEILGDVRFRVTPLTDRHAAEMVREIKGYRLLEGYRGHQPADIQAIEEVLLRTSRLVEELPEISELDMNPIFALPPGQGCRIVDARIRVERPR